MELTHNIIWNSHITSYGTHTCHHMELTHNIIWNSHITEYGTHTYKHKHLDKMQFGKEMQMLKSL